MTDRTIANGSGASRSPWMTEQVPRFDDELPGSALAPDVCVVGAGIAGLAVADALVRDGLDVLVLDRGPIGGGQTARSSGHLASALDDRFHRLERWFGADGARLAAESHAAAIDLVELNTYALSIESAFRRVDGYLFLGDRDGLRTLSQELDAARRAGLDVAAVEAAPLPFSTGPCLRFENQAELQPVIYIRALAQRIVEDGGRIATGVHVVRITGGTPPTVALADGRVVRPRIVVDATATTLDHRLAVPLRVAAYRTYCIAARIPPGSVTPALYWDTGHPYHYIRLAPGDDTLIVGGEDHRTGHRDPTECWPALERWTIERFPLAGPITARWSGQVMEPADGLALIGPLPGEPNVLVVTGDSGNGLTHATIASMILPTLIHGGLHPWSAIYDPARRLHAVGTVTREAMVSTVPYADWMRGGDVHSLDDVPPGEGAVIRQGVHRLAAYRDDAGNVHLCNARCTHKSGVVRWNSVEKTWDCPCHGSRFDVRGRVVTGPATEDLVPAEEVTDEAALPAVAAPA